MGFDPILENTKKSKNLLAFCENRKYLMPEQGCSINMSLWNALFYLYQWWGSPQMEIYMERGEDMGDISM